MSRAKGNVDKAKELLRDTDKTISAIAEETGANYKTIYYHATRLRDDDQEKKAGNGDDLKSAIEKATEEASQDLKDYVSELIEKLKDKDELIERLQSQAHQNEEDEDSIWQKKPSVDWKAQHDDLLEKYEKLQAENERRLINHKHDREEYQGLIDHLTEKLQAEQERANYHGKRDHHLTEIFKLG